MKKIFWMMAICAMFTMGLVSCGNNSENVVECEPETECIEQDTLEQVIDIVVSLEEAVEEMAPEAE